MKDIMISIVGSLASGKSHYIGVLIDELRNRVIPNILGGSFSETDESIREMYMQKYYYPLYQLHQPLVATCPNETPKPLTYETQNPNRKRKNLTFIFNDRPGENYGDLMTMTTVNQSICKSSGIILLVDPLQIEEIRSKIDKRVIVQSLVYSEEQDEMICRMAHFIRHYGKMQKSKKIDIPVAVVVSKLDAVTELLPHGSIVSQPGNILKTGKYDKEELRIVDEEMRNFLDTWSKGRITRAVEVNFSNVAYFGVAALEKPLNDNGILNDNRCCPRPFRVADPFLWILNKNKIIR